MCHIDTKQIAWFMENAPMETNPEISFLSDQDQDGDDEFLAEDLYCSECLDSLFGWEREVCDRCRIRELKALVRQFIKLHVCDGRTGVCELVARSREALKR